MNTESLQATTSGRVTSDLETKAELAVTLTSTCGDPFTYTVEVPNAGRYKTIDRGKLQWAELVQSDRSYERTKRYRRSFGPCTIRLLFYLQNAQFARRRQISLPELRSYLRLNAGVKIYRDGIRVKPYGNLDHPEGDWLSLGKRKTQNPAGAGRASFRLAPKQLVGAVFISRDDNPHLSDSAAREGLVENDAFNALRQLVTGTVILIEAKYHERFVQQKNADEESLNAKKELRSFKGELLRLKQSLTDLRRIIPKDASTEADRLRDEIDVLVDHSASVDRSIEELASHATTLRGLATLGIASAVFGHETQIALDEVVGATNAARLILKNKADPQSALDEIEKVRISVKKVAAWGTFALTRTRRDKRTRRKTPVHETCETLLKQLQSAYDSAGIDLNWELADVDARTFEMDVEAILINLLTNAYTACLQKPRNRQVFVEVRRQQDAGKDGFEITVSDSGPGIPKDLRDRVWEPLFSTKLDRKGRQSGTGLGLSIVRAIVDELSGKTSITRDQRLHGARVSIWLPG